MLKNISSLREQSEASFALRGAAAIEVELEQALLQRMQPISGKLRERLFKGYGPLSTFAAKSDLSFALKIIDQESHTRLKLIRDIRNDFAHKPERLSFESPQIAERIDKASFSASAPERKIERYFWILQQISEAIESSKSHATDA